MDTSSICMYIRSMHFPPLQPAQMESAIECSRESESYSREMDALVEAQKESINLIRAKVQEVSAVVSENTQMASESAEIANSLADEVQNMNAIVARK